MTLTHLERLEADSTAIVQRNTRTFRLHLSGAAGVPRSFVERLSTQAVASDPGLHADVHLVLVDAKQGLTAETRRHSYLLSLRDVRATALLVAIDGVGAAQASFAGVEAEYRALAEQFGLGKLVCIPIAAREELTAEGRARATSWYRGPTLADFLDAVDVEGAELAEPFRMFVDSAAPTELSGTVAGGIVRAGDTIRIQPSGRVGRVARIAGNAAGSDYARRGETVTLGLQEAIEARPGDLVATADRPAEVADKFEATISWTSSEPLLPGRSYVLRIGTKVVAATITPLKYKVDVDTLRRLPATELKSTEVGVCSLELDQAIPFDSYRDNPTTGGFLLLDPVSKETVGAGSLHFALRRAQNVHWQAVDVNKTARSQLLGQKPCVLWYTGLSGAGKSTIANLVDKRLHAMSRHTYLLDGDNVRHGLNKDLGFTATDRVENIRRIAEVAKLMIDAGLIVGTAFISPFRAERQMARALLPEGEFIEIYVDTPLAVAEERDPKGLYKKARRGELKNFTGIDSPYEAPESPEIRIDTTATAPEEAADLVVEYLRVRGNFAG